jgi:catechol 2,3-dioxygenase-like lactoylglutathione lyase family enzyme
MAEMTARLDHVGLAVADLGAAAAWYCDVFGLVPELSLWVDAIDLSIEMLIHPGFGYRVELLPALSRSAMPST